jgi:hypothetical protein
MRKAGRRRRLLPAPVVIGCVLTMTACFAPFDLNGDNKADLDYMTLPGPQDPPNNPATWFAVGSSTPVRSDVNGVPVEGNYDGQGNWELAEVNRANGIWTTAGSRGDFSFPAPPNVNGSSRAIEPVPARYDGHNTTEAAWYRPADAMWFIEGHDPIQFGTPESTDPNAVRQYDIPVPGDYNGDGTDELAVYHPSDSTFHIQGDPNPIHVGTVGDLPAPADYDGDGKVDPATFHLDVPSGVGTWHIAGAPDVTYPNGWPNDGLDHASLQEGIFAAPADYDGDGKADPAVAEVGWLQPPDGHSYWRVSTMGDLDLGPVVAWPGTAPWVQDQALLDVSMARGDCHNHGIC